MNNIVVYECKNCEFLTDKKQEMKRHIITKKHFLNQMEKKEETDMYFCYNCDFKTLFKKKLNKHFKKTNHRFDPTFCSICKKKFYKKQNLIRHYKTKKHILLKQVNEKLNIGKSFEKNNENVNNNNNNNNNNNENVNNEKKIECKKCGFKEDSETSYEEHLKRDRHYDFNEIINKKILKYKKYEINSLNKHYTRLITKRNKLEKNINFSKKSIKKYDIKDFIDYKKMKSIYQ